MTGSKEGPTSEHREEKLKWVTEKDRGEQKWRGARQTRRG